MWKLVLRRLIVSIPLLLGVLTVNFFLIHAAPGDPSDLLLSPEISAEARESLRRDWGLDDPLLLQYAKYLERTLLHLDLGYSLHQRVPVEDVILAALPHTLVLSLAALAIQLVLGVALGILCAARAGSALDGVLRVGALVLYSTPTFYLGLVLLFLFAGGIFHVLPASGVVDIVRYDEMGLLEKLWNRLEHLALPAVTLGLGAAAGVSRYMRSELLEVIHEDYIRTARSKGLDERTVLYKHALRNALMPLVTIIGLSLPFLFSGSVIVENVFGWPGMGRVAVSAVFGRDYPVFLAVNLAFAALVIAGSLVADLLYAIVDPRIRYR